MRHMPDSSEAGDDSWTGSDLEFSPHNDEQLDHRHQENSTRHSNTTDPTNFASAWPPSSGCHHGNATSDDVGMGHAKAANGTASALHHPPPPPLPSSLAQPSSPYPGADGSDRLFSFVSIPLGAFVVIILVFLALKGIFVFLMWRRRGRDGGRGNGERRPARPLLEQGETGRALGVADAKGLDLTLVASLPTHVFRAESSKGGRGVGEGEEGSSEGGFVSPAGGEREPGRLQECPVCLCDYQDGDSIKTIPLCSHGFHVECIDAWLGSKTTCPLCRVDLRPPKSPLPPLEGGGGSSILTGDGASAVGGQETTGVEARS